MNQDREKPLSEHYNSIVNALDRACMKGCFGLIEAHELTLSLKALKAVLEQPLPATQKEGPSG